MEQVLIAESDMIVYKGLSKGTAKGEYTGPYKRYFQYRVGEEYYQTDDEPKFEFTHGYWGTSFEISVGLHASLLQSIAVNHSNEDKPIVGTFIIPKGSQYFTNGIDVVCDRYIFKSVKRMKPIY